MAQLSNEEIEKVAAFTGVDSRRLRARAHRLCPRCEKPLKGKRTAVCEGAPYAGQRLDVECIATLGSDSIGDEGAD